MKRNCLRKGHVDAHADAAMVRCSMEVGAHFPDLIDEISADDKAKVKVGILAVSRYHQFRNFVLNTIEDMPNYSDHDYNESGWLLTPSGYLVMTLPEMVETETDSVGS